MSSPGTARGHLPLAASQASAQHSGSGYFQEHAQGADDISSLLSLADLNLDGLVKGQQPALWGSDPADVQGRSWSAQLFSSKHCCLGSASRHAHRSSSSLGEPWPPPLFLRCRSVVSWDIYLPCCLLRALILRCFHT